MREVKIDEVGDLSPAQYIRVRLGERPFTIIGRSSYSSSDALLSPDFPGTCFIDRGNVVPIRDMDIVDALV